MFQPSATEHVFKATVKMVSPTASGRGMTKKQAKHVAAAEMLVLLSDAGRYELMPGLPKAAAVDYM